VRLPAVLSRESGGGRFGRAALPGLVLGVLAGAAAMRFLSLPPALVLGGVVLAAAGLVSVATRKSASAVMAFLIASLVIDIDKTFFLNPDHSGGAKGVILSLWNLALIGWILLRIPRVRQRDPRRFSVPLWVSVPLLILFVLSVLSLTQAISLRFGLYQLIQLAKVYVLFFVLAAHFRDPENVQAAVNVLFAVFLFELVIGYLQYSLNRDISLGLLTNSTENSVRRIGDRSMISVSGTLDGSDRFSSYLIMMLLLFMGWMSGVKRTVLRLLLLGAVLAGTMLLVFTFSRGGWIGFSAGVCVFAVLHWRIAVDRRRALLRGVLILGLLSLVLWFLKDFILLRFTGEDYGSAQSRIPMMQIAFGMIRKYPWLGVGMNNYTLAMTPFDRTGLTLEFFHPVHNVYLQLAAEVGIPGLIVFLFFLGGLFVRCLKSLSGDLPLRSKQILIGCISGLTALMVHYTVNNATIDSEAFLLFWVFAAVIVSLPGEGPLPADSQSGRAHVLR
jgi:putative inorganic carbon (hco3(-)) transporter